MSNQLTVMTPEIKAAFPTEVLEVIRTSLCPTATDPEFLLFAHKAASYGLDPFKNEIFFIKYGNAARIQFAAEAYLSKAREKEGFQPSDTQMVCENDEFKMVKNLETKEMEVAVHEIGFPRGKIIGAYSIAYRDGYRPVTVIMDRSEIEHMFSGQNKDNWNKWTTDMFGKHVEQRGLKKQYGLEFGEDDLSQLDQSPDPYVRKDVTNEVDTHRMQLAPEELAEYDKNKKNQPTEPPKQQTEDFTDRWIQVGDLLEKLGHKTKTAKSAYINAHFKTKSEATTHADFDKFIKLIEMEIAENTADDSLD